MGSTSRPRRRSSACPAERRSALEQPIRGAGHPQARWIEEGLEPAILDVWADGPYSAKEFRTCFRPDGLTMVVDVETRETIARPRAEVAAYASDPDNATAWYENIERVEWRSPRPLQVGSRLAFVARFLGRRLEYTYEVREHVPGERFVMRTAEGPFPMETTYTWEDASGGGTTMTLRNRGEPAGFAKVAAPMMARAMARANRADLRRLKGVLEGAG
jgi:hypothetical protein